MAKDLAGMYRKITKMFVDEGYSAREVLSVIREIETDAMLGAFYAAMVENAKAHEQNSSSKDEKSASE